MLLPASGTILPGSRWRSLGKAGHTLYSIVVLKRTAGGKVVFMTANAPSKRMRERKHTMEVASFLLNYAPLRGTA